MSPTDPPQPPISGPPDTQDSDSDDGHVTLAKQGSITFIGDIVKKSFGFIIIAIITRLVSPSVYGLFILATSIILFVQVFATLGLPRAIDYYVPQYLSEGRIDAVRGVFIQVVVYVAIISVLVGIVLYLTAGLLAEQFGEPSLRLALVLLSVALPLLAAYNVLLASFNGIKKLKFRVYVRDITRPTTRLVATALLLIAGFGLIGVVGGYIIGLAACIVVGSILLIRYGKQYVGRSITWTPTKELFWYSVPLAFASVIYVVLGQVDYLIVGYFLTSEDVGFYRVGYMLGENLLIFFAALAPVFKPLIAEERTNDSAVRDRYQTAVRWVIGFTLPVLLILTLGATTYLSLIFTPQYVVAAPVIAILAVGYMLSIAGGGPGGSLLQGLGYSRLVFINTALLFITNITVSLLLVPRIGILGAAVGSSAALGIAGVAALVELYYYRRIHPFTATLGRVLAAAVPAAIAGAIVVLFIQSVLLTGVILPIVVLAVYLFFIGLFGGITESDATVAGEIDPRLKRGVERINSWSR
ncbi:flippase [Natronocalculus amylovorans]|uniref:Flippase n=1 Tax=Natronocalculus amylovorans TaxID=2917812 RepID=A0AAE3FTW1_9EURY|nr:flippase [Natronocalculus amylovorans]MCL9815557.1 flippase [Natronocalculus amylovorans]